MRSFILLASLLIAQFVTATQPESSTFIIPSTVEPGPSDAQFIANAQELDAPHLALVNSTSWEWWYYDVISPDGYSSFAMAFFATPRSGFFLLPDFESIDLVSVWGSFPNGSAFTVSVPAEKANVEIWEDSSSGVWEGTGVSWVGAGDGSQYVVTFDSPGLGITGSLILNSRSPAHFPCGPAASGQSLEFLPHIGWSSIIPTGAGVVDIIVNGTSLRFSGSGYHDMNWGDTVFTTAAGGWSFGHGNLGPYSIVWFSALSDTGVEYPSGYVTYKNKVLTSACNNVIARPTGANSTYPPLQSTGNPTGFHVEWDLGEHGLLAIDVTPNIAVIEAGEIYTRWMGVMEGGIVDQKQVYNGAIIFEELRLLI